MGLLKYYPKIEEATQRYSSVNESYQTLLTICNGAKRRSGRLVIDHCVGTAERLCQYTSDPIFIQAALLHDSIEDGHLSFQDVKNIAGDSRIGEKAALIVAVLSKPKDVCNKYIRDNLYMRQLLEGIKEMKEMGKGIAATKLCDRLDNIVDLAFLTEDRSSFVTWQSLSFYVPLALKMNLLGLSKKILGASIRYLPNIDKRRFQT